jgi:hypothetical protein
MSRRLKQVVHSEALKEGGCLSAGWEVHVKINYLQFTR